LKNGFGFVEFRDNRDAEDVVYDFHGKEFLGERLELPVSIQLFLTAIVSLILFPIDLL
jgi:RNA recognition motif-containing protein